MSTTLLAPSHLNGVTTPLAASPLDTITGQVMTISPAMAADLLKNRPANRPMSKSRVRLMIEDMRGGRWQLNGEPVILTESLAVLDGQHRLQACMESGIPLVTMVVVGVAPSAMASIDQGARKTAGDILTMAALPQAQPLAAASKWLWRYSHGRMRQAAVPMRNAELPAFVRDHPGLEVSLAWGRAVRLLLPWSCGSMLHYLMSKKEPALAKQYFLALAHGEELKRDHPAHVLREKFLKEKAATSHLATVAKAALIVTGWVALRRNAHLPAGVNWRGLHDVKVPFPTIV